MAIVCPTVLFFKSEKKPNTNRGVLWGDVCCFGVDSSIESEKMEVAMVFRGKGNFVIVVAIPFFFPFIILSETQLIDKSLEAYVAFTCFALAAAATWFVGRKLNKSHRTFLAQTKPQAKWWKKIFDVEGVMQKKYSADSPICHSFTFLKFEYWAFMYPLGIGGIYLFLFLSGHLT